MEKLEWKHVVIALAIVGITIIGVVNTEALEIVVGGIVIGMVVYFFLKD